MTMFKVIARYDAVTDYVLWVSAGSTDEAVANARASARPWAELGSSELGLRSVTATAAEPELDDLLHDVA